MEFGFKEEERALQQQVRQFALKRLLPQYQSSNQEGAPSPRPLMKEFCSLGISSLRIPEEFGGVNGTFTMAGIACEEASRGDFLFRYPVMMGNMAAECLKFSPREVQAEWLPRVATGDVLAAAGFTEPSVGSDLAHLQTRAVRDGDDWVISGEKASVSLTGYADVALVAARTGREGPKGISMFWVPLDLPGITRQVYHSMGQRSSQRGSLFFDGVRVPQKYLIGEQDAGFYQVMHSLNYTRAVVSLATVGAALQSIDETIDYIKARSAFGRPIAKYEGVSFVIAEHLTMLEAGRLLCYRALWLRDQELPMMKEAAMAKWWVPAEAVRAINDCLVLHGHYGYSQDLPLEQRLREVTGAQIGDGTPQINKLIILRDVLGRAFLPERD